MIDTWAAAAAIGLLFSAGMAAAQVEINEQHNLLQGRAGGSLEPGDRIAELEFNDLSGNRHSLAAGDRTTGTVFVFLSTACPVAKRYTARLERLHGEFSSEGFRFFGVFANSYETVEEIHTHAEALNFPFAIVRDEHGQLVRSLGATMTPQVFVIDRAGRLRYRGGIDDNRYETRVKRSYLRDALTAVASGREVREPSTASLGCTIHLSEAARLSEVTYSKHIARILQENCQVCHRPNQVAPFPLLAYKHAKAWAEEIKAYTSKRLMPPWKAAPDFGEFKNERNLSQDEIELIARWVEEGMAEGDSADLPPPKDYPATWTLGEPDLIVEMPEEYVLGPEGEDDYRHFIIPTDFAEAKYIRAVDVRPGNLKTVHHVIVYVDTSGKARELDQADPGPGYTNFGGPGFDAASMLGGWAPGTFPAVAPDGLGTVLQKGGDIVMQVHYYRSGVEERDRTKVGLYFATHPNPKRIRTAAALNTEFVIPPGEKRYEVHADLPVREDVYALSVYPHMHLLGEEMKVTAELPDGRIEPLIWIPNWDFNWQGDYYFREPLFFPKGTTVKVTAYFNNSAENPNNPHHPPQPVGWGEKTTDEMCLAFLSLVKASDYTPEKDRQTAKRVENGETIRALHPGTGEN